MTSLLRYVGIATLVVFLCTSGVVADIRPPNTPELQRIMTSTSIQNVGLVTEQDSLVWRQSNEVLDANLMEIPVVIFDPNGIPIGVVYTIVQSPEPPLQSSEVQMINSIRENTLADQGMTGYTKQSSLDTDWKPANIFNVEQQKSVSFIGSDTGRIVSEESALIDAAGRTMTTVGHSLGSCPFTNEGTGNCVPAFCNIVEMGSSLNMKEVQFSTDLESRTIAPLAIGSGTPTGDSPTIQIPLPVIDGPPTELNYGIRLTGAGEITPAIGSAGVYMNSHIMDGSKVCPSHQGLDNTYNEITTARGDIALLSKDMHYDSGIRCMDCGA